MEVIEMVFRELKYEELFRVNEFYSLTSYTRRVGHGERVFIAESEAVIIGALTVERIENVNVLRGMYVLPEMVGRKIGSKLLKFVEPFISESNTYCIPYKNLINFYGKIGFSHVAPDQAPFLLLERFQAYLAKGLEVVLMCRQKAQNA
jgi:GNAT superfamily N-acetyltransferase